MLSNFGREGRLPLAGVLGKLMETRAKSLNRPIVLIRGAGELATGAGWVLAKAGYRVVMTEVEQPLMVRWPVCFGTAIILESWQVEGINAVKITNPKDCKQAWFDGEIPVMIDPNLKYLDQFHPTVLIDAIMAKKNIGTEKGMASFTIGLGPGFSAGDDVDVVIETNRGHNLGRLIYDGPAEPNTGVPGEIGGYTSERVAYSPHQGVFKAERLIGESVSSGDVLGEVIGEGFTSKILSPLTGIVRGLLRDGTYVDGKVKSGDIDPRAKEEYCWSMSEKARSIGSAALLAVLEWERK